MTAAGAAGAPAADRAWWAGRRLARFRLRRYALGGSLWAANHVLPLLTGLVLKVLFDRLAADDPGGLASVLAVVTGFVAAEALRAGVLWAANVAWPAWWLAILSLIRGNVLRSLLCDPEPPVTRLPGSSGEALGRVRDDAEDVVWFVDVWVDVAGGVIFAAMALAIMIRIDPVVALVVVLPMVAVLLGTRVLTQRIRATHGTSRASGAEVTSMVGELVGGALALKVAGAESAAMSRLREVNRRRGADAVRARVVGDLVEVCSTAGAEVAIGLVLLLTAGDLRSGDITVGDIALFTTYAGALTGLPRWTGRMLARHRQAAVSLERLARLLPGRSVADVVAPRHVDLHRPPPARPAPPRTVDEPLRILAVEGLTAHHPGAAGRGIDGATFAVPAGTFTVIAGAVGSGKTTLVRALLGLLRIEAGVIRWNGRPVEDAGSFLVPPRAAYAGQVARLFSDPLGENLQLGWQASPDELHEAIALAALDADVAELPEGLATRVGPRGVRLSGGQLQRASAARALVRRPGLLVLDDLSSALDVETEAQLWERLAAAGATILAVSHRRAALERADQVVVVDDGRVVATGALHEVLAATPEMRRLWREELVTEGEGRLMESR